MMAHAKTVWRILTGVGFMLAGLNHFRQPALYRAIMPGYLPNHGALVAASGGAEIALGALVLVPRFARSAGVGLQALLVAVFPANVHMACNPQRYRPIPAWALWARLPLQILLIRLVGWCTTR